MGISPFAPTPNYFSTFWEFSLTIMSSFNKLNMILYYVAQDAL